MSRAELSWMKGNEQFFEPDAALDNSRDPESKARDFFKRGARFAEFTPAGNTPFGGTPFGGGPVQDEADDSGFWD